jgi:hypothetical protein
MKISTVLIGLAAGALLSGCAAIDALHTADVYDQLNAADVISGPVADPEAVALRTGTASYTGLGVLAASDGTAATAYLGDATIQINFDAASVTGGISMYRAKGGLDPATDPEAFFDQVEADPDGFLLSMDAAAGSVTLSNGVVVDAGFTADVTSGDLTVNSTTVVVTGGTVGAEFTGATANGVRSTTSDVTGTVNGTAATQIELYFAASE